MTRNLFVRTKPFVPVVLALVIGGLGCRKRDTLAPVELEVDSKGETTDTRAYLPPWTGVAELASTNGLLVHWLQETEAERIHIRVSLPTLASDELNAARVAILGQALTDEVRHRLKFSNADVRLRAAPGRLELVVFADHDQSRAVLRLLARSLGGDRGYPTTSFQRRIARLQGTFVANYNTPALERSVAQVTADLLELPLASQWGSLADFTGPGESEFRAAFHDFTDPGRAWLTIHSRHLPEERETLLSSLAENWPARTRRGQSEQSLLARLHRPDPSDPLITTAREAPQRKQRGRRRSSVKTSPPASLLEFVEAEGHSESAQEEWPRPVLIISRRLNLTDPQSRCHARLAQRVLQEHFDARLVISGPLGLFSLRLRLPRKDPAEMLANVATAYEGEIVREQSSARLRQAAKLYLGGRMVETSLNDEDWTALWSQAIDLASKDRDIPSALHAQAECMLHVTPEQQAVWQRNALSLAKSPTSWRWQLLHSVEQQRAGLREFWPEAIELEDNDETQK